MQIKIAKGPTVKELKALEQGEQEIVSFGLVLTEAGVEYPVEVKMTFPVWRPRAPHWYFCSQKSFIKGFLTKARASWANTPQDMCISWDPVKKSGHALIKGVE
jgi:hypothetical protein